MSSELLQIKAIQLNVSSPFTWASGLRSPVYCDNRLALSYPDVRRDIVGKLADLIGDREVSIAGVATAGIAWGALVAEQKGLHYGYVRSSAKGHGMKKRVEGFLPTDRPVVVIEDLVSTGGSVLSAVDCLRQEQNLDVEDVFALFSYDFAGIHQRFVDHHCRLNTLATFPELLERALHTEYIERSEYQSLQDWHCDPKLWSEKYLSHS